MKKSTFVAFKCRCSVPNFSKVGLNVKVQKKRQPNFVEDKDDKLDKGTVTIPYLKGFSQIFKRIVSKHRIKTAFRQVLKLKNENLQQGDP